MNLVHKINANGHASLDDDAIRESDRLRVEVPQLIERASRMRSGGDGGLIHKVKKDALASPPVRASGIDVETLYNAIPLVLAEISGDLEKQIAALQARVEKLEAEREQSKKAEVIDLPALPRRAHVA